RSRTILIVLTWPAPSNSACKSDSVVSYGRLPTYSLVLMNYSSISKDAVKSDGRLERNARRRNAGEARNSNLMREARSAAVREQTTVYHPRTVAAARAVSNNSWVFGRRVNLFQKFTQI